LNQAGVKMVQRDAAGVWGVPRSLFPLYIPQDRRSASGGVGARGLKAVFA
jgi:hypothetical protein